jgi:hypothetical protein
MRRTLYRVTYLHCWAGGEREVQVEYVRARTPDDAARIAETGLFCERVSSVEPAEPGDGEGLAAGAAAVN